MKKQRFVDKLDWIEKVFLLTYWIFGGLYTDMYRGTIGAWWVWRLISAIVYAVGTYMLYKILWDKEEK